MNRNDRLMKTFHKSSCFKAIPNLKKIYQNNNYLIQIMKQTEKMTHEKPFQKKALTVKNVIRKIHTENNFYKNPSINKLKNENEYFETEYKKISKKRIKRSAKFILNDLIDAYEKRSYKIPKLSPENNIFKINPLVENNTEKMSLFFYKKGKTINVEKEKISNKVILFLNKLRRIINNIEDDKKTGITKAQSEKCSILKNYISKSVKKKKRCSIEKLNEDIDFLKKLYNKTLIESNNTSSTRKGSYSLKNINLFKNSQNKNISYFSLIKKKSNTINIQSTPKKKFNSKISVNEDILTLSKNKNNKKDSISIDFSPNNFLFNRCFTKCSDKSQNNSFFDIENKLIRCKSVKKETEKNFRKKTKLVKNIHKKLPIFIRTQAANNIENDNDFFLGGKKSDFKLRNRNLNLFSSIYGNRTDFVNFAYKKVVKGKYNPNEMENCIKKYLIESKDMSEEESMTTINNIKNMKNYLSKFEQKVKESDLRRKTEKLYLNNSMIKRIEPTLSKMKKREDFIFRLQNIFSNVGKL